MTTPTRHAASPAALLIAMVMGLVMTGSIATGCGGAKEERYGEIASVYADLLVAQLMYGKDTARRSDKVDSILNQSGYESVDELYGAIAAITSDDPRGVRIVLDSTQARLEEIREGSKKDSATGRAKTVREKSAR